MKRRNWLLTGALALAALLALLGPLAGGAADAQTAEPGARLRFLHAVSGGPSVDVYLDGARVVPSLAYGEMTPHVQVPAGEHQVALRPADSDPTSAALVEVTVPLAADLAFTVVAQGTPDAVQAALYEDILDEIAPGLARLTAINAVPDAPGLDVLTTAGGPLLQGVNYSTQFGSVNIGTGVQDLVIVPAGGAVDSALVEIGEIALEHGALYTFAVMGTLNGAEAPWVQVIKTPLNVQADGARLRVANASLDSGPVDVYLDDVLIAPALELGANFAQDVDEKIASLFGSLTGGTIGAAGGTITWAKLIGARSLMQGLKIPGPYWCVLHPYQWAHLATSALASGAEIANAPGFQDALVNSFFTSTILGGVTFVVTPSIAVDGAGDAVGAMYNPMALAYDERKAFGIELQRDASRQATELNATMWYAYGTWDPKRGIALVGDAATPS